MDCKYLYIDNIKINFLRHTIDLLESVGRQIRKRADRLEVGHRLF